MVRSIGRLHADPPAEVGQRRRFAHHDEAHVEQGPTHGPTIGIAVGIRKLIGTFRQRAQVIGCRHALHACGCVVHGVPGVGRLRRIAADSAADGRRRHHEPGVAPGGGRPPALSLPDHASSSPAEPRGSKARSRATPTRAGPRISRVRRARRASTISSSSIPPRAKGRGAERGVQPPLTLASWAKNPSSTNRSSASSMFFSVTSGITTTPA